MASQKSHCSCLGACTAAARHSVGTVLCTVLHIRHCKKSMHRFHPRHKQNGITLRTGIEQLFARSYIGFNLVGIMQSTLQTGIQTPETSASANIRSGSCCSSPHSRQGQIRPMGLGIWSKARVEMARGRGLCLRYLCHRANVGVKKKRP